MPAATSIADIVKPMTSAVPRSGWETTSRRRRARDEQQRADHAP